MLARLGMALQLRGILFARVTCEQVMQQRQATGQEIAILSL